MDLAGSSSSGSKWSKNVSPLSADDMVELATFLLADPHWGPSLREKIHEIHVAQPHPVWFDKLKMKNVEAEVRAACPHLEEGCVAGITLTLLPLWAQRSLLVFYLAIDAGEETVAAFYAALRKPDCAVTDLTVSGSAFGTPTAAALLGRCLDVNLTIQELTISDVPGFCHNAVWTAFFDAITSNATLQRLRLESSSFTPGDGGHVGGTLANAGKLKALQQLVVCDPDAEKPRLATVQDMEGWGTMLVGNATISQLELDMVVPQGGGMFVPVCNALLNNSTLKMLTIGSTLVPPRLGIGWTVVLQKLGSTESESDADADARSLTEMLRTNQSLACLNIKHSGIVCNALVVSEGLSENTTLEELCINVDDGGAQALMTALTPDHGTASGTGLQLKSLTLGHYSPVGGNLKGGKSVCFPSSKALQEMLALNETLTQLHLLNAPYTNLEWASTILPALESNHCLRELDLCGCQGVDGGLVYDALLVLLNSNTCITHISLHGTPLFQKGKEKVVQDRLDINKGYGNANREYEAALRNVPTTAITSCRLLLCGYPHAGKSRLLQTMVHKYSSSNSNVTPRTRGRIRGIDIQKLTFDDHNLTMWVWSFASHKEFHPLKNFIFPSNTSVHATTAFVFTFNPLQYVQVNDCCVGHHLPSKPWKQQRLEQHFLQLEQHFHQDFSYWLKFICSNAKAHRPDAHKPLVFVVVTHKDKWRYMDMGREASMVGWFKDWVQSVAKKFAGKVNLEECNLFFVDATNKDDPAFGDFMQSAVGLLRERVSGVSEVPAICDAVAKALGGSQQLEPIISCTDFQSLCRTAATSDDTGQSEPSQQLFSCGDKDKAIAAYLCDIGELLYIEDLPFLVRNPRWFVHGGILGPLIDVLALHYESNQHPDFGEPLFCYLVQLCCQIVASSEANQSSMEDAMFRSANGLVTKAHLAQLLKDKLDHADGINTDNLILLMEKLDLCYQIEQEYLIPALLQDKDGKAERGECKREWVHKLSEKCIFVSSRLQCSDPLRTFITPGFFPRLQVMLRKKAYKWKDTCDLEKYFIRLTCKNGMEVLVEHSGSYDYFVDIMVQSCESREDTEKFLQEQIINKIRRLCASTKGCQGVSLVEGIIRPDCVGHDIVLCRHRQSILVTDLKEMVNRVQKYFYWKEVKDENGNSIRRAELHDCKGLLARTPQVRCGRYPDENVDNQKKRGLAVIVSMEKHNVCGRRSGGSEDRKNLQALAWSLHFEVIVMLDYEAARVLSELQSIVEKKILEEHESFVCFVNGHGGSTHDKYEVHYFLDQDNNRLYLDEIMEPLRTCKHLEGKPKVFFVNSCRGINMQLAHEKQCQTSVKQEATSQQPPKAGSEYQYVAGTKDFLVVFSTSGRSVSIRYTQSGTSFVRALQNAFTNERKDLDVLGIVTCAIYEVSGEVHEYEDKDGNVFTIGQCPVHVSTLTKYLYWR